MNIGGLVLPRPLGTLVFLSAWLVPWRSAYRIRSARSGLDFFVHHRDTIGRHIAKYGTHEPLVTRWMAEFLDAAPRGIVVDIGANLGWHALHAAKHRNADYVVAFEPDPFNAWLLDRNIAANGISNVITECRAVGAGAGVAQLFSYKSANYGRHSLAADHGHGSRSVPVTDLDGALANLKLTSQPISLIKIDVEGYEPAVIAGATSALTRTAAVILEYSPDLSRAGDLSVQEMMERLQSLDFIPFVLRADGGTSRLSFEELQTFAGSTDLVFVRAGRLAELAKGMSERERDGLTLLQIAEQNKKVVTPI